MTCSYCGSRNGADEHRCRRCGRRPTDLLNVGALATKPDYAPEYESAPSQAPAARQSNLSRAVQRPLWQESNVIPFESYAAPAAAPATPKTKTAAPRTASKSQ